MTAKDKKRKAIVVLPAGRNGRISSQQQRRWLSRSTLQASDSPMEMLTRVLSAAGLPPVEEGLAALRLWGQTGDRPNVWIAAADPVHLEARLDHLCLNALQGEQSLKSDLRTIFDFLQRSLGEDTSFAFARIGKFGYLRGNEAIATASLSAAVIDGLEPDEFMPARESAAGHHKLLGEMQMCLHEHEVNQRRESLGLLPVNSLWFWGGGEAPEKKLQKLPHLFGGDPLFKGYWESCTGLVEPWLGSVEKCLDIAVKDLVVVTPASGDGADFLATCLMELRDLLKSGRLHSLVLLFRDGLTAEVGRFDAFRFWRRASELL